VRQFRIADYGPPNLIRHRIPTYHGGHTGASYDA
jgi:hypothetical protein